MQHTIQSLILLILMGTAGIAVSARTVFPNEAMRIAEEFLGTQTYNNGPQNVRNLQPSTHESTAHPYYIFNSTVQNHGFVIISGDDRAPRILGYSNTGSFDPDNVPPQLIELLTQYASQIASLKSVTSHPSWKKPIRTTNNPNKLLLETANWGQGAPYNTLTPEFGDHHSPTGCVATAMAIVMKYHNWPPKTKGESMKDFYCQNLSFDFSNYTIDWDKLSNDISSSDFESEVSKFMLAAGVSAHTEYGEEESNSRTWYIGHVLTERFSYSPECQFIEREHFDDVAWHELIDKQLNKNLPILYVAQDTSGKGHCFVVDGKSDDSYYHINWGWDGLYNGYYTLDNLNPEGYNFKNYHSIVYNIMPDHSGRTYSRTFISNADIYNNENLQWNDWNFSSPDILPGETYHYVSPFLSLTPYMHSLVRLAIVDANDEIVDFVGNLASYTTPGTCPHPYNGIQLYQYFTAPNEPLPNGCRYQLVGKELLCDEPEISQEEKDDLSGYKLIFGGIIHPSYFMPSGNLSELCNVHWHRDSYPVIYGDEVFQNSWATGIEFLPKGGHFARSLICPKIGKLNMAVDCKEDGNTVKPVYVFNASEDGYYSSNVSLYSDEVDIYLNYSLPSESWRVPEGIAEENIIHQDGLVYYINENDELTLCGYDDQDINSLIIPDCVTYKGKEYLVTGIEDFALLGHNASTLQLGKYVVKYGKWSLGYLKNLKNLIIPQAEYNTNISTADLFAAFSPLEKIFVHSGEFIKRFRWHYILGHNNGWQPSNPIELYLSDLGDSEHLYPVDFVNLSWKYIIPTYAFQPSYLPVIFNIPGINIFKDRLNGSNEYKEMWLYSIDKVNGKIKIQPNIEGIELKRITINDVENHPDSNHLYTFDKTDNLTVKIDYCLFNSRTMTTIYPPDFNEKLPDENLDAGIGSVNADRVSVWTEHDVIRVSGTVSSEIKVYNTLGALVYKGHDSTIGGLDAGLYLVVANGTTFKVIL